VALPGSSRNPHAPVYVRTRNDVFQWIEVLKRNRAKRRQHREALVEGVVAITRAVALGWTVHAVIHAESRPLSRWANGILAACPGASRVILTPALLEEISDKEEPSELLLVVGTRDLALESVDTGPGSLTVVLDRPASPGNLGSVLRSCSAFGCGGLVLLGHAADPWDPRAIRASLGAVFSVPFVVNPPGERVAAWLAQRRAAGSGLLVAGADPAGAVAIDAVGFARPTVLILGNEKHGLAVRLREMCDLTFAIPMTGVVDSLNLAAAATVALYEAGRQRRAAPGTPPRP
jgi:23S rRNA (uridine2479-2'-O)-methyltransferase